jgi:hypothetical protein
MDTKIDTDTKSELKFRTSRGGRTTAYNSRLINYDVAKTGMLIDNLYDELNTIFKNLPPIYKETNGGPDTILKIVDSILKNEVSASARTQLIDIPVRWLQEGDYLYDYGTRSFAMVKYASKYDATLLNDNKPNTVCVAYYNTEECDNFNIDSTVSIVINPVQLCLQRRYSIRDC